MSQERAASASAVPLEELGSWPAELCRRELPTVLPRLLISFAVALPPERSVRPVSRLSPQPGHTAAARPCGVPAAWNLRFFVVSETETRGDGGRAGAVCPRARACLALGLLGLAEVSPVPRWWRWEWHFRPLLCAVEVFFFLFSFFSPVLITAFGQERGRSEDSDLSCKGHLLFSGLSSNR